MTSLLFDRTLAGSAQESVVTRIFQASTESAIIAKGLDGTILFWNEGARRLYGYEPDEVIGKLNSSALYAPENLQVGRLREIRAATMRDGKWEGIITHLRRDGQRFTAHIVLTLCQEEDGYAVGFLLISKVISQETFSDQTGKLPGTLATAHDIAERGEAEAALRDSQARLAGIVDSAMDAVITVDSEQRIKVFNRAAEKMFRCPATEAIGQPLDRLIPARFRSLHSSYIRSFGVTGITTRDVAGARAGYGLRADGEEFPLEASISQVGAGGQKLYTVMIRDITERERAEERFRQLIEGAPNGMVMVNQEGKLVLVNAEIEKSFGYTRDELLGQPIERLVPERFRAHHLAYREGFMANPTARPMGTGRDLFGLRKDGSEFPVEIGLNPLDTEQGAMVLGTIVDISERRRAEEKLRRSQEQLAGVIGSAMDAIVSVDEEQRIVLFNAAAERMFLYPSQDAIGQPLNRFIPKGFRPGDRGQIEDFGRPHVAKRPMGALEAIFGLRADGEEFPIEASISELESEGRTFHTLILRDITERKRADEALKEHARILDLAPVLIRDLSGRIIFWNSGAEQMYGWNSEEAVGNNSHTLLQMEFPRPLEEIKARVFAHGHWEGALVHTKRNGGRITVASRWVLHKDENDVPRAVLEIHNDITERRQAEEEVRRLNEELEQRVADRTTQLQAANKELEAFSYSVSHDLRAPLRQMDGFSQALLEDYADKLDEEGKGFLQKVRSASQEMAQLIDDMLQLARVTRREMRQEVVNLSELAHAVLNEMQEREPGRTVLIDIQEQLVVEGDKRLLRIMLVNLFGNAWKFTSKREQAEIAFGREEKGDEVVYFVRDNGAGFEMAYADKLFGAFQRLHNADEFEGTGVGLATVQRIVNRHRGRVWAEGLVDKGATFYFTLPKFKEKGHER